jgi:ubiquinone/menaquinone biosynthesis C-methylase UbiE
MNVRTWTLIVVTLVLSGSVAHSRAPRQARRQSWNNQSEFSASSRQLRYVGVYDKGLKQLGWYRHLIHRHARAMPSKGLIIDAGGGTGNITRLLMKKGPRRKVLLMDLSDKMMAFAASKGIPTKNIVRSDITRMSINGKRVRAGSVSGITCNNVLYILDKPERALKEFARVLRPGGRVSLSGPRHLTGSPAAERRQRTFLTYLDDRLQRAVDRGVMTAGQKGDFYQANNRLAGGLASPMSNAELIAKAARFGLKPVSAPGGSAYGGVSHFLVFEKR